MSTATAVPIAPVRHPARSAADSDVVQKARPIDRLIRSAQRGDAEAKEALLTLARPSLMRFAARLAPREADREDAVQEALNDIAQGLSSYRWQASFLSWCYVICARRVARAATRSTRDLSELRSNLVELIEPRQEPHDGLEGILADQDLNLSCALVVATKLTPVLRRAYLFGDVLGVTDVVGGELCACTPAAFRQRVSRARRLIAHEIRLDLEAARSPIVRASWAHELDRLALLGDLHRAMGRPARPQAAARAAALVAPNMTSHQDPVQ